VPADDGRHKKAHRLPRGQRAVAPRVTLSEEEGVRYLHFGTEWVQGAMRIARPFALELQYQQQLMAPLVFLPAPHRILQLGLGAGALAKFCWRELPQAAVTAVEISAEVAATARQWFKVPDDERLEIVIDDARSYIAHPRQRRTADWLQVDLYDASARGPVHSDEAFYAACRAALRHPGVAAFNLFGRRFDQDFEPIAHAFDDRVVVMAEADAGNRIVLGFAGPLIDVAYGVLFDRALEVEGTFRLPARKWIAGIRAENGDSERLQV
jgi:spermidine synthase